MITGIVFGGLGKPASKPKPLLAPLPAEYQQPKPNLTIKNRTPKPL
jgi:hypothetical protein